MILNSVHTKAAIESERHVILSEAKHIDEDSKEFVLENVHYAAYRDHMMGQPILGNKRSILEISRDDL
jgi:processing peptidase subunit beta